MRVKKALNLLILMTVFASAIILAPRVASADQLILNGNFDNNLSGWTLKDISKGVKTNRDGAGNTNSGSLRFYIPGRRSRGEAIATQQVNTPIPARSGGGIDFAFKKNWKAIAPASQRLYINLIKPDKSVVTVWEEKNSSNDNIWITQSVDISGYLDQSGTYAVSLGAAFENGNTRGAATYAWFDDVKLNIYSNVDTKPTTSILNPTGTHKISGSNCAINGVATDDVGVSGVEVAIVRLYDNTWWNGNSWVNQESWSPAAITSSFGDRSVTWSYPWPLPTSDGGSFEIMSRATDIMGNREAFPVENFVSVDNVGPSGNIYINDAASYTNKREVRVNIDVSGASQMRFSPDNGITWASWESFAPTKALSISEGDGAKIISAQFRDDSDNMYRVSTSINLDTKPPVTKRTFPAAGDAKVLPESVIGVIFYESMDPSSYKNDGSEQGSTFYIKQGSRWVAANVTYDEKSKTAKLLPREKLDEGTSYTAYLTTGVKDLAGNPLAANFSWSFTTTGKYKSSSKAAIGPGGGKLEDGNQIVSLEIPEGALSKDTEITVDELRGKRVPGTNGATRYSGVYQFSPKQLTFSTPATLTIKYKRDESPDPTSLRLVFYNDVQKKWEQVGGARIDLVNNQITAQVTSLSAVTVISLSDIKPPTTTILSPTGVSDISGAAATVYGLSLDDKGVSGVEVAIVNKSDNSYWNGSGWQNLEVWIKANITRGRGKKEATWSYLWVPPKDRREGYEIKARAIDSSGNIEPSPATVQVRLANN